MGAASRCCARMQVRRLPATKRPPAEHSPGTETFDVFLPAKIADSRSASLLSEQPSITTCCVVFAQRPQRSLVQARCDTEKRQAQIQCFFSFSMTGRAKQFAALLVCLLRSSQGWDDSEMAKVVSLIAAARLQSCNAVQLYTSGLSRSKYVQEIQRDTAHKS